MTQLSLFDIPDDLPPQAARLAPRLSRLGEEGVFFGTSSWKYPGWLGTIYSQDRYTSRGKFQQKRFEAECLEEYARVFPLVGGDFSFYMFPSSDYWQRLFGGSPDGFLFALKVPEEITVPVWPRHARYGTRAGQPNDKFLDVDVFLQLFARPLAPHRDRVAALIFEFGTYARSTFATSGAFLDRLASFLDSLPPVFRYAVEVRNPELLGEGYFSMLASHKVAHLFNAWTRMPALNEQIALPGAHTADFIVSRALLKAGRPYEEAVRRFEPYERVQEPNEPGRLALRDIVIEGRRRRLPTFLLVNNRYEGHAPSTIEGVLDLLP